MDILSKNSPYKISLLSKSAEYLFVGFLSGFVFFLATNHFGLGITNDSVNYISASMSVMEGMKKADGTSYTEWPPLFPLLLSISNLTHIKALDFAKVLHGVVYIANTLLMLFLLKINIKSKPIYLTSVILLIFSVPFIQMHVLVWSEPIFMLLIIINICSLKKYATIHNNNNLILLILIGCLMYLQRKTGTIFIISSSLLIFLLNKSKKQRLGHSIIYLFFCSIPVFLWYQRRYEESGKIFGAVGLAPEKVFINAEQFLNTFTSYFFPSQVPLSARAFILFILLILILFIILKNKNLQRKLKNDLYFKISFFNILFYYITLLVFLIYIHIDDEIDDRILSPVYLPLLLCMMIFIDTIYLNLKENKKISLLVSMTAMLWLVYPISRTAYHLHRWNTSGTGGYNTSYWNKNKLIAFFEAEPKNIDTIYTNGIHSLKYFLNFKLKKDYIILPDENLTDSNAKSILVCFEKDWTYPKKECEADKFNNKEILIRNQDGEIWQMNIR